MAAVAKRRTGHLFRHAKVWLEKNSPQGLTKKELARYFDPTPNQAGLRSMSSIYRQFLESLANANMKKNVIIGSLPNGIESLAKVSFNFSTKKMVKAYGHERRHLWGSVKRMAAPTGKKRARGLWPKYCQTMLEAAAFLNKFDSSKRFRKWVEVTSADRNFPATPALVIANEIYGAGFALACNVLIDLGFDFAKPDVHVRRILTKLDLLQKNDSDYQALKVMFKLARGNGVSVFALDKAMYLIGSANYFLHPNLARMRHIRKRTDAFVRDLGKG